MKKGNVRFNVLSIVLLFALLFASVVNAAPKDGPTVKLSVDQSEFNSGQDVLVNVTVENTTKHTVRVLKWYLPINDGMEEPLFAVRVNGEPVAYIGAIYKRPAITGNDYVSLKAGESMSSVVNLGEYYDISYSGEYEVAYAVASYNLYSEKGNAYKFREVLVSEKIGFKAEGRAGKPGPTPTPPPSGGTAFNVCTTDQQNLLKTARTNATNYSSESYGYLSARKQGSRYTTWFGLYDLSRYNLATSNFNKIKDAFVNAGITFDCGCKQNYYAYVYPNQPYKIYLCKVFWTAPATGTDSKAGTLIHEMSHFDVVAATDDYVYGQTGAKNLAISDPGKAVMNADNHEYFAENTPFLP